jgi:ribosomal protein S18 acetylase RimI-like enzyme
MKFEKLDLKKHSTLKVSELIYEADVDTFNFFFKNKANAAHKIEKLIIAGDNSLGYRQIYVMVDHNQVLGVLVFSAGEKVAKTTELKVLFRNLNLTDSLKFIILEVVDNFFLADLEEDDYYLAVIAVDEDFRGQGVGSFILKQGIKLAQESGFNRAVLDVDMDNEGALRLYERFGFKKFKKKSISLPGWKKGAFNMEFLLTEE